MIDANLVAEYLDDQLTPELVARIEREILQSDVSLAEVAATHEILGLLRDPVELEPRLRDRLYALDPSGKLEVVRNLSPSEGSGPASGLAASEWKPLSTRTGSSKRLPVIIMGVLAVVWVALIATDDFLFHGKDGTPSVAQNADEPGKPQDADQEGANPEQVANADGQENANVKDGGSTGDTPTDSNAGANAAGNVVSSENAKPAETNSAESKSGSSNEGMPTEPVVPETGGEVAAANPNPVTPAPEPGVAGNSGTAVKPVEPLPVPVKPNVEPELARPAIYVEDELQMTLLLDSTPADVADLKVPAWKSAARVAGADVGPEQLKLMDWQPVFRDNWLGVSAPFKTGIRSGGWKAKIAGPALIRWIHDSATGLEILEGRLVVQPDPAAELAEGKSAQFLLRTGPTTNLITFAGPEAKLSIEVIAGSTPVDDVDAVATPHPALLPVTSDLYVAMFVMEGSIRVRTEGTEQEAELQRSQILTWRALPKGGVSDVELTQARPQEGLPEWAFVIDAPPVADQLDAEKELAEQIRTAIDVNAVAEQQSASKNPQIAVMSAQVLSVVRDVDRLANIFLQSSDEHARRAAIDGLSRIAVQTPAGQGQVQKVLENRLPMSDMPMVLQLIVGVTEAQAGDSEFCGKMVGLLSNDRVATRDLALYRMETFTKDRFGYHADADAGRRRDALRRWLKHLERNGGKLLP